MMERRRPDYQEKVLITFTTDVEKETRLPGENPLNVYTEGEETRLPGKNPNNIYH